MALVQALQLVVQANGYHCTVIKLHALSDILTFQFCVEEGGTRFLVATDGLRFSDTDSGRPVL